MRAVGDQPSVFLGGDGASVVKNVDASFFKSTSAFFVGEFVNNIMKREEEILLSGAKARLQEMSQEKADRIVRSFEKSIPGPRPSKLPAAARGDPERERLVPQANEGNVLRRVTCSADRLRNSFGGRKCAFDLDRTLSRNVSGELGSKGLSDAAVDLLDVAESIYRIERMLPAAGKTNEYVRYRVKIPLRTVKRWRPAARDALTEILSLLGTATWEVTFEQATTAGAIVDKSWKSDRKIDKVALFSGGVDSTCGASTLIDERERVQLCSFYTRQKDQTDRAGPAPGSPCPDAMVNVISRRSRPVFLLSFVSVPCASGCCCRFMVGEGRSSSSRTEYWRAELRLRPYAFVAR